MESQEGPDGHLQEPGRGETNRPPPEHRRRRTGGPDRPRRSGQGRLRLKSFVQAGKPGIYFAVLEEGVVGPGDPIERIAEDPSRITVAEMFSLVLDRDPAPAALRRLLGVSSLAAVWRKELEERLGI
jgi:3-alpha domain